VEIGANFSHFVKRVMALRGMHSSIQDGISFELGGFHLKGSSL
jgi:hypothetical protein